VFIFSGGTRWARSLAKSLFPQPLRRKNEMAEGKKLLIAKVRLLIEEIAFRAFPN
jgi:hypothetical protein